MKAPKWTDHQLELLLRAFEGGAKLTQIADVHNVTSRRISQLLVRARFNREIAQINATHKPAPAFETFVLEQQRSDARDCLCAVCVSHRSKKSPK